jgi:hypothetical protein
MALRENDFFREKRWTLRATAQSEVVLEGARGRMTEQIYPIVPASGSIYWVVLPLFLVLAVAGGIVGYAAWASRHVRFAVSEMGIRISGDLYGRAVPADQLLLGEARRVNLKQDPDLRPSMKTNGIGLPGYRSGWFRLRNGGRALAFITDETQIAYLPTTEGWALLLSVPDPAGFIQDARARMRMHR